MVFHPLKIHPWKLICFIRVNSIFFHNLEFFTQFPTCFHLPIYLQNLPYYIVYRTIIEPTFDAEAGCLSSTQCSLWECDCWGAPFFNRKDAKKLFRQSCLQNTTVRLEVQLSFSSTFVTFFKYWYLYMFLVISCILWVCYLCSSCSPQKIGGSNEFIKLRTSLTFSSWETKSWKVWNRWIFEMLRWKQRYELISTCSGLKTTEYTDSTCYFQKRWHMKS